MENTVLHINSRTLGFREWENGIQIIIKTLLKLQTIGENTVGGVALTKYLQSTLNTSNSKGLGKICRVISSSR